MKKIEKILADLASLQETVLEQANLIPCPRCGKYTMKPTLYSNALSRQFYIMICDQCGLDEALRAMKGIGLPFEKWAAANKSINERKIQMGEIIIHCEALLSVDERLQWCNVDFYRPNPYYPTDDEGIEPEFIVEPVFEKRLNLSSDMGNVGFPEEMSYLIKKEYDSWGRNVNNPRYITLKDLKAIRNNELEPFIKALDARKQHLFWYSSEQDDGSKDDRFRIVFWFMKSVKKGDFNG